MYQPPKLNVIGDARDVVLGTMDFGKDLDDTFFIPDWEYGEDLFGPNAPWQP
jgi:hypothetical protein